jgi:hypothetical protein
MPLDDRRERGDARKHLIRCGFTGILDVADYQPFLVEKRCHVAILLQVGCGKRSSLEQASYGAIAARRECVSNVTERTAGPYISAHEHRTIGLVTSEPRSKSTYVGRIGVERPVSAFKAKDQPE